MTIQKVILAVGSVVATVTMKATAEQKIKGGLLLERYESCLDLRCFFLQKTKISKLSDFRTVSTAEEVGLVNEVKKGCRM